MKTNEAKFESLLDTLGQQFAVRSSIDKWMVSVSGGSSNMDGKESLVNDVAEKYGYRTTVLFENFDSNTLIVRFTEKQ